MFARTFLFRDRVLAFGRRRPFVHAQAPQATPSLSDDVQLFVLNFLGGLLFMTVYLA